MISKKTVGFGILIIILYWIIESLIHLVLFSNNNNLIQEIFISNTREFLMRLIVITLLILTLIYFQNYYTTTLNTKLRITEEKYQNFIQNFQGIAFQGYPDFSVAFFHGNVKEITGYTEEDFLSRSIKWDSLIHPNDFKRVKEKILEFNKSGRKSNTIEHRIITKDGTIKWILSNYQRFYDTTEKKDGVRGILLDVTELRKAEQMVRLSEERYRELVENANCIIIRTDRNGKILFLNEYGESFFGDFNEKLVERYEFSTIVSKMETLGPNFEKMVKDVFQYPERYKYIDNENITKNGKKVWVSWTNKAIKSRNGDFIGILSVGNDITERKVAEQKLKEREGELKNLEHIINHSPAVVFLWRNAEGWPVDFVSDNVRQFGFEPEDFYSGKVSYADIIHSDDLERVGKEVSKYSEEEQRKEFVQEYRILTKSGKTRWLDDRTWIRRNSEGEITHYQGIILDITNRKLVEEKLRESEEKFRTITEQSLMGICIAQDNKIKYINKTYADIWGYSIEEMMQWGLKDAIKVIHPNDRAFALKQFLKKQRGEQDIIAHYQYRGFKKSGEIIWVDNYSKPIIYRGKSADLLTLFDITEKKEAEQKLRESEEKFRTIAEQSLIGIGIIQDNTVKYINHQVELILECDASELLGLNPFEYFKFVHPSDKEETLKQLKKIKLRNNKIYAEFQNRIITKKGNGKWINYIISNIIYNKKPAILVISTDITDLKNSESALKEHTRRLELINRIIKSGSKNEDLSKILNDVLASTLELMNFDGGCIYIITDNMKHAELFCHKNLSNEFIENEKWKNIDVSPYNIIFKNGKTIFSENYYKIDFQTAEKYGFLTLASIPLVTNKNLVGFLNVATKSKHNFPIQEKDLLLSIGRELGSVVSKIRAVEALKKSKKFLSDVFMSIQDGICIIDKNHNILQVNPKMEEWYSHATPIVGKKCFKLFCRSSEPCEDCYCFKSVVTNEPYIKIATKKQRNFQNDGIIEIFIFPFKEQETGEITGIVEYIRDISEKHEYMNKMMEYEKKSEDILENIKEGYFEVSLQGNFTFLNKALCQMLGYSNSELIGTNFNKFMDEDTNKKVRQFFYKVYKTGIPHTNFQFEILNKNLKNIFIETSLYLRYDVGNLKIGFCGLLRDITEQKKAEKIIREEINKLKELDILKNEFVYRASHELKTPLNSISSASNLLLELHKTKLDSRALNLIKIIIKGGERLEFLIKNLLDVSKIESGKFELNIQKENITEIIKEILKDLFYLIQEREMRINLIIDKDIYIMVDKIRIEQVLENLIANALYYTPPKGLISINAKVFTQFVEIYIIDSGIGFTEEEKNKIFKKFGKIERYGKGSNIITEGTGLGLYISKEIIELHDGKIWVESKGRNKGSKFIIRIPIIYQAETR
ncbi:MAG: PAS domain S-box protein [Promethearchaeota archaeon]